MMKKMSKGRLFIISGPSGSGKDTVLQELFKKCPEILFSISSVTRPMRQGETEGEKYIFDKVIFKYISKQPIYVGDIDFDAFDEDDITTLIDDKCELIESRINTLHNIVNTFAEMPARVTTSKRYF